MKEYRRRRRSVSAGLAAVLTALLAAAASGAAATCPQGLPLIGVLEGDLGPAPGGAFEELTCLEIRNDDVRERRGELAVAGIPLARSAGLTSTANLAVVGPGDRRLAAQFEVLSRWGGPVDDVSLPIRWLQVAVEARVGAQNVALYSLRRYDSLSPPADPLAAGIQTLGTLHEVDTGLATFTLDSANPSLFEAIGVDLDDDGAGRTEVYRHRPGAGPKLVFESGGADVTLGTQEPAQVAVDPGGFRILETGPVQVVVQLDGHFSAPGGAGLCTRGGLSYERFGYTLVATMKRGRRDLDLEFHFRNECSDAAGGPWTDDAVTVVSVSWEWPFDTLGTVTGYFSGAGTVASSESDFDGLAVVEQRKGGGAPWRRRARILIDGALWESAEEFTKPMAALGDGTLLVAATMPWMRFREPQSLALEGKTLSLRFISERLIVGEGKGLWNHARLSLTPAPAVAAAEALAALRDRDLLALERGLLVRTPLAHLNDSGVFAGLGTEEPSLVKTEYRRIMTSLHDQTVGPAPGGQWHRSKTFGSQLWPDVQADSGLIDNDTPFDNSGAMNYWNPSGAELLEFLRSGEPRWVWDFALPQSWLQAFTAYLNIGGHSHGNRAGLAVTSGGEGEGQWHRSANGSDDYSYDMGLGLAYVLRPSPALRDRFRQAGRTVLDRYDLPKDRESERERWVSQVDFTRQVIQHFEMLANCAEFVPGQTGLACHDRLLEIVRELAEDNLRAGLFCQGDVPSATFCATPQQFMQNALMYLFADRIYRNYGDPTSGGLLRKGLVEAPLNLYAYGLEKRPDGSLVATGDWAAGMECSLSAGGTAVEECVPAPDSDNQLFMYAPTRPQTAALLLMADQLEPSLGLCPIVKEVYDDPGLTAGWQEFLGNDSGWWKGAAQMMQGMVFGVGLYDTCGCAGSVDLVLENQTLASAATFEACHSIVAGPKLALTADADVTLRAGHSVVLRSGFSMASGAMLRVEIDPSL